jgi:hypothetical protein
MPDLQALVAPQLVDLYFHFNHDSPRWLALGFSNIQTVVLDKMGAPGEHGYWASLLDHLANSEMKPRYILWKIWFTFHGEYHETTAFISWIPEGMKVKDKVWVSACQPTIYSRTKNGSVLEFLWNSLEDCDMESMLSRAKACVSVPKQQK